MCEARGELAFAVHKLKSQRCNANDVEVELLAARAYVKLQSSLCEESRKQLNAKLAESKEMRSQLEHSKGGLVMLHDQQTRATAELSRLLMQNVSRIAKTTEAVFVAECERPARRGKVVGGSWSGVSMPSTAAYSANVAERDEFENR